MITKNLIRLLLLGSIVTIVILESCDKDEPEHVSESVKCTITNHKKTIL